MPSAGLTSEQVVDRAGQLADSDGLPALSLTGLAEQLGVRPPSLYKHVDGLGDLHRRMALAALSDLRSALRDAAVGVSGQAALLALCHAYRHWARDHPGRYASIQRAPAAGDPEHQEAAHQVTRVLLDVLRGYGLDEDAAVHAARSVRSALHGFVVLELAGGFGLPQDVDDSYAALLELLHRGLTRA